MAHFPRNGYLALLVSGGKVLHSKQPNQLKLLPVRHAHGVGFNFTREYNNKKEVTTRPLGLYNVQSLPICLVTHLSLNACKKLCKVGLAGSAVQSRYQPKLILAVLVT